MLATITLNRPGFARLKQTSSIKHDAEFASRINVDACTVSRVTSGKNGPGTRFIAGCMEAFGTDCFADLFLVVPDEPVEPID